VWLQWSRLRPVLCKDRRLQALRRESARDSTAELPEKSLAPEVIDDSRRFCPAETPGQLAAVRLGCWTARVAVAMAQPWCRHRVEPVRGSGEHRGRAARWASTSSWGEAKQTPAHHSALALRRRGSPSAPSCHRGRSNGLSPWPVQWPEPGGPACASRNGRLGAIIGAEHGKLVGGTHDIPMVRGRSTLDRTGALRARQLCKQDRSQRGYVSLQELPW
jgi:hypothetical protein